MRHYRGRRSQYDTLAEKRMDEDEVWVTVTGKLTRVPPDQWPPEDRWPRPGADEAQVQRWEQVFHPFKVV